ncbi:MAG: DciA family protein [Zavarzinella sp.]
MDGPEKFSDILAQLFTSRGWGRQQEANQVESAWLEVITALNPDFAPQTRCLGIKRKKMEVEVNNGVLFQELTQFHERNLLRMLQELLPNKIITGFKFRRGNW